MTYVNFKYILKSNFKVQINGTVEVPNDEDANDADFEITFKKDDGLTTQNLFINHYGVEITGKTDEQDFEIDTLKQLFCEDFLFLTRISDNAGTKKVIDLGEAYLVINGTGFETIMEEH